MSSVVELDEYRPHNSGKARCLTCSHEHVAVAPVGVTWMECPACHTFKATWVGACQRDGLEWQCKCGNDLFHVKPEGTYCPHCGEWQKFE